jgi:hypothetical protein
MGRDKTYYILLATTILSVLAAISTLIPDGSASEDSLLGYRAHCPFSPASTVICLLIAGVSCIVRARRRRRG